MNPNDKDLFFETAWETGLDLVRDAVWDGRERCTWTGNWFDMSEGSFRNVVRSFGPDLYSGTSGILYFLCRLYEKRHDPFLARTIEGCASQVRSTAAQLPDHGFYSGKPGAACVLAAAGYIMEREDWAEEAYALLRNLKQEGFAAYETDIISGIAGTIPALKLFHELYNDDHSAGMVRTLATALCNMALKEDTGWSWPTVGSKKNLTGFSHGAAGIACALLDAYRVCGDALFLDGAREAIRYEQHYYHPQLKNWPDFREAGPAQGAGEYHYGVAWCHGAPGIALARMYAYEARPLEMLLPQIDAALDTTYRHTLQMSADTQNLPNFSLCHGICGNADVLLSSGRSEYTGLAAGIGLLGIQRYHKAQLPWPGGIRGNLPTPGMMMGLAGTGYYYLRLADPDFYGSVLVPGNFRLQIPV